MIQNETKIYYTLRIAAAMCFIGHGTFGIIGKEIWCNYFAVFGIGHDMAYKLMPWLGSVDILMGLSLLIYPTRAVLCWLVIWGAITAFLRPMSGEPFAEFIERAGNFGAPLVLLVLCGRERPFFKDLFSMVTVPNSVGKDTLIKVRKCLQVIAFLLLLGHGGLNVVEKKGIMQQYTALGLFKPGCHCTFSRDIRGCCRVFDPDQAAAIYCIGAFDMENRHRAFLPPLGTI